MVIQALAFYMFAAILLLSGFSVITARNPVHSVLFLILSFFTAAGLFIMLGAEFIALLLVIVYVGAVAVLFLFVVMMLDINFADLRAGATQYVPIGLLIGGVLLAELVILYTSWKFAPQTMIGTDAPMAAFDESVTNTEMLGRLLYTDYILAFQIGGLVLFVAMIGAIVLTLRSRPGVRKQNVANQQARKPEDVLEVQSVAPRTGV